jgi:4-hydroxyphenylpyruvate dioxygenase
MTFDAKNPLGMRGIELLEIATHEPAPVRALLRALGFAATARHAEMDATLFRQNDVKLLVTSEPDTMARAFAAAHGPSVSAMALRVRDAGAAHAEAIRRGARPADPTSKRRLTLDAPAIYGIGDSLVYFVGDERVPAHEARFVRADEADATTPKGFLAIDHLTNNVGRGELGRWADFYKGIFGFTEVRSFDIRGQKTGLYSYALRSPCGTFCIPINEDKDERGQIAEYLKEYRGPGVQHIALLTRDLLASLDALGGAVPMLDIDPDYYDAAFARVPNVREARARVESHSVLVDGDDDGYLLQIFTKNVLGPIFFELIQRENHLSFGEGNFGALFRSIERDQERRGVI